MSSIAVFFDKPGKDGYPFNLKDYYGVAYTEFALEIEKRGAALYIVRTQESYLGGNCFKSGWVFEKGELKDVDEVIEADLIFNKGNLVWDKTAYVINVEEVERLCTDKSLTYATFPLHSPQSRVVHNAGELAAALAELNGDMLVAKPLNKEGGEGVHIAPRKEIGEYVKEFPYIIQEFIDTSAGIPGLMDGHHDLRIASVNGVITHCYYRTPPQGSLLANVAGGGQMYFVTPEQIPAEPMGLFKEIDVYMSRYAERIYSVDMGRNSDGRWMIIEMNSRPGLLPRHTGKAAETFQIAVADMLTRLAAANEKTTN